MDGAKNKMGESNAETKLSKEQFSDFVEAAAHDLHAPLRKLSVLIERLFIKNAAQFNEESQEYITRIENCIGEMRSLIDDLTELAKAGATSTLTQCDLNLIVKQALEMMREEIEEKRAEIHIEPLPIVQGNTVQYQQLFRNLLENAVKFSKKDTPVEISVRRDLITDENRILFNLSQDKTYHKIEIIDNGIGFNPIYAEKIFEPFIRLHSAHQYEGNGLGLSICRKIVTNHLGIIYAEGIENEGSRFSLILPETP